MNRTELIKNIANDSNHTNAEIKDIFEIMEKKVVAELLEGNSVDIGILGKIKVKKVEERTGRNPATNESVIIAAHNKVSFTVSPKVKKIVR